MADEILDRLAAGELLVEICKAPGMPALATVYRWREANLQFREAYARAREMQAQACAERAVMSGRNAQADDAAAARVRFDADRWLAARLDPRNYGEKVTQEHTGPNGSPLIPAVAVTIGRA